MKLYPLAREALCVHGVAALVAPIDVTGGNGRVNLRGTIMNRLTCRLAAGAALALAVTLTGCGGTKTNGPAASGPTASGTAASSQPAASPATNGLEKQTPAQVMRQAGTALNAAKSVHIRGYAMTNGQREPLDLRIEGAATSGILFVTGARVNMIMVGKDLYFKTDKQGWDAMGAPPGTSSMMAGRWVKVTSSQTEEVPTMSLADLGTQLAKYENTPGAKVAQGTLNGQKVVTVTYPDGMKFYVANVGPAQLLRFEQPGPDNGGQCDLSEQGAAFHITAPTDAMEFGSG
jgi:hypothetical protein